MAKWDDRAKLRPDQKCSCDCAPVPGAMGRSVHYRHVRNDSMVVCVRTNCRCVFRPPAWDLQRYEFWPVDEEAQAERIALLEQGRTP